MTMPATPLLRWRESKGFTPSQAARFLRVALPFYSGLEAGRGECPPSLALDIMQRTGGAVNATDLPGCATPSDAASPSGGVVEAVSAGAGARPAPDPVRAGVETAPPATGAAGGEAPTDASPPSPWAACVLDHWQSGTSSVMLRRCIAPSLSGGETWVLSPVEAADLGMGLIRAALAARPARAPDGRR